MKAIETVYNGYRFRSRLEARWAVFFDALGIEYQYELEGIDLDNGLKYLPDFFLPKSQLYIEIKSKLERYKARENLDKWERTRGTAGPIVVLIGDPWPQEFDALIFVQDEAKKVYVLYWRYACIFLVCGLACLGIFPNKENEDIKVYPLAKALDPDTPAIFYPYPEDAVLPMPAYTAARQARFEHGETPNGRG